MAVLSFLLSFLYLISLFPEHMLHHSFISKWRIHHCPKSVVWLALLNGRFCVTHVYFMSSQTICFLSLCLIQIMRNSDSKGVYCRCNSSVILDILDLYFYFSLCHWQNWMLWSFLRKQSLEVIYRITWFKSTIYSAPDIRQKIHFLR